MTPSTSPTWRVLDKMRLGIRGVERDFYFRPDSSDVRVVDQVLGERCYDLRRLRRFPEIVAFLAHQRSSGRRPLIVDAGANIGAASVYFSTQCPDADVLAIEPDRENYELLTENCKGLSVTPLLAALAATSDDRVQVVDVGEGAWGYRTRPLADGESGGVRTVGASRLLESHAEGRFPFIVKIDIEGGEKELFETNVDWIDETPVLIIELHDWLLPGCGSAGSFLRCVAERDRDFVYIGEDVYSLANRLPGVETRARRPQRKEVTVSTDDSPVHERMGNADQRLATDSGVVATDFEADIAILCRSDAALLGALADREARLREAQDLLDAARRESTALQAAHDDLHAELKAMRTLLDAAEGQKAALRDEAVGHQSQLKTMQTRLDVADREKDVADREKAVLHGEIERQQSQLTMMQTRLDVADRDKAVLHGEIERQQSQLTTMQTRLDVADREKDVADREKAVLHEEIERQQLQLGEMQDLLDEARRQAAGWQEEADRQQAWLLDTTEMLEKERSLADEARQTFAVMAIALKTARQTLTSAIAHKDRRQRDPATHQREPDADPANRR